MRYSEASRELGLWMAETWHWSIFFTLTVRDHSTGYRAGLPRGVHASEKLLAAWTAGSVEARGGYWWAAMESHRWRSTPHFHGLAGGFYEDPSRIAMWAEWRALTWEGLDADGRPICARAQLVPVRDAGAVGVYVAKYVSKGLGKIYTGGELVSRKKVGLHSAAASAGAGRDVQCAPDPLQTNTAPRTFT